MDGNRLMGIEAQMAMAMGVADLCKVLRQVWQDHVLLLPDQIFKHAYLHQHHIAAKNDTHALEIHAPALGCLCL